MSGTEPPVRDGWAKVRLGDVCEFRYGKALPAGQRSGSGYPVYGSNGEVGRHEKALTIGATIVVGRKGSFGEVCFSVGPCWPIDTTYFVDKTSSNADLRWLFHLLRMLPLKSLNRAAAIPGLNREDAYDLGVLLPPIEEQRRIAAVLDAADALRAKRKQALAKFDSLTQAIFIDMFGDPVANPSGWPVVSIGDCLTSATYGTSKKAGSSGEFAVLRMGNLTYAGEVDMSDLKYIDLDTKEQKKHLVHAGDVLFNRTNSAELVGKTAVYRGSSPVAYAGYLVRLQTSERLHPEYLGAFMNLPSTKAVLQSMCKSIVGMANINAKEVQRILLPVPPRAAQDDFAAARDLVASRRESSSRQLAELDTLFASLQQRAFRGEL